MAKRKRAAVATSAQLSAPPPSTPAANLAANISVSDPAEPTSGLRLQVVTGTYEKTLHGFIVEIPAASDVKNSSNGDDSSSVTLPATFIDTFLFNAHTSPLRALTISPPAANSTKCILATSSADERINLYTLSTILPRGTTSSLHGLSGKNRHLGTLHHHLNTPTALVFTPSRSKLISAGADGQINILRCRDWSLLSSIKAPKSKPKPINYVKDYGEGHGPRIDSFGSEGYGGGQGAINDIALHPSQKILLSVGAKERAVRMWNLMTGRKAGVLAFDKKTVPLRFGTEGNKVGWRSDGGEYAVAFDRGIVVFGMDSKAKAQISTTPFSKVHMMRYVTLPERIVGREEVLVIATEDGRVLFYDTTPAKEDDLASVPLLGTLGGRKLGMPGRIKDFAVLKADDRIFVVTGGSDGTVRVWDLCGHGTAEIEVAENETDEKGSKKAKVDESTAKEVERAPSGKQVGRLVGIYETARRITCLAAMLMVDGDEEVQEEEEEDNKDEEESSDEEDSE